MRKPQPVIFERALAIAQVKPERVVFVDDREQNLAPARAQGMQTVLFTSADALRESLKNLGLLYKNPLSRGLGGRWERGAGG